MKTPSDNVQSLYEIADEHAAAGRYDEAALAMGYAARLLAGAAPPDEPAVGVLGAPQSPDPPRHASRAPPADLPPAPALKITLYLRTYPVAGAPLTVSLAPLANHHSYTYPSGGVVYDAAHSEVRIVAPSGATVEPLGDRVRWDGDSGRVRSTPREVLDLALAGRSGFRLAESPPDPPLTP